MNNNQIFDVVIIGGSYSGLSAALSLVRLRREILIIDHHQPCNRFSPVSHNFLTRDRESQSALSNIAKNQVLSYTGVRFINAQAVSGKKEEDLFIITTETGERLKAKKVIFATGVKDEIPNIKGFKECWGISIVHCPYCHGYEMKDQKTAILANGNAAYHLTALVRNLTSDLIILTEAKADFTEDQLLRLSSHDIKIIEVPVAEIIHCNGLISNIMLEDGVQIDIQALYTILPFRQRSDIPQQLGCDLTDHGLIKIDDEQRTTIPGIYACGDNSALMRSVSKAVYSGNLAGAIVNAELTEELF
ncbi:NAD(P)/FAD-dependent oxidoreductase [Chryseobacterium chendengshani]|uniref:NAD(P)/FAD-dependent oxidoreductase n=1 Tax=Chryseobacterium sp. LJ756 TaxID=2864113 RepID=UPI001C63BFEF|nr:NAD(P)/FAD-dependent oxidoreductase [Chryseobacterium sp. LJ756]MBW7676374.1 NAD(P)/FAD-dependent oxidoreductase [Chryseobacterium sp. LJ756]